MLDKLIWKLDVLFESFLLRYLYLCFAFDDLVAR